MSSPLSGMMDASRRVVDSAKTEIAARKARKKNFKTNCGHCGRAATGTKLQTCSRCKSVNYCSAACQREHWKTGHKQDCNGFAYPPFAKNFDTSEREDVPWPIDPIFASKAQDGVGMWMTTNGTLSTLLQQAFEPVIPPASSTPPVQGPPSYLRWAGVNSHTPPNYGPELMKRIGSTMLGLRVVVQNRRQDGRVVTVFPGEMELTIHARVKSNLLPDDLKKAKSSILTVDKTPVITIPPWTDYNGALRVGIFEINGVEAPKGEFKGPSQRAEYQPPSKPSGQPWDRIVDWESGSLMLAPGDFAVFGCQYRVGDGDLLKAYPDLLDQSLCISMPVCQMLVKSTDTNWCDAVRRDVAHLRGTRPPSVCFMLVAPLDHKYFDEYYKPYFDEDSDVFAAKRLGGRAAQLNDMVKSDVPMMMNMLMSTMTPENRAEAVRRFNAMGIDIEQALRSGSTL